ncbi:hypothetical protein GOBAR_AA34164 [Gossypium barbadense]|uniref:Histone deacetylase interacting domain-containing protein n=1 Tax=Gossypium barbadense TaxID=3634 RepID=A0A2P5W622_GOSBA|nr:hypothetical protein GOBAR_AA34164 [Gossypium barbadense]
MKAECTSREAAKNVAAAKRYLKEITETFEDRKEKLVKFREVMKDFKTNRTDVAGVVERVKELFEGHNNLLKGFNFFLPMGYEITVDKHQPPPKKMIGFLEPKDFMRLIKERDKHVYWSFVDVLLRYQREQRDIIKLYMEEVTETFADQQEKLVMFRKVMNDFGTERTDVAGVVERVKELFKGHNNLLKGFNFFLPMGYEITVDKDEPPPEAMAGFPETLDFIRVVKERDERLYRPFMDVIFRYWKEHMDVLLA